MLLTLLLLPCPFVESCQKFKDQNLWTHFLSYETAKINTSSSSITLTLTPEYIEIFYLRTKQAHVFLFFLDISPQFERFYGLELDVEETASSVLLVQHTHDCFHSFHLCCSVPLNATLIIFPANVKGMSSSITVQLQEHVSLQIFPGPKLSIEC